MSNNIHLSPPFVRAPAEDRSKYEKLMYDLADNSSEDSDHSSGNVKGQKDVKKRHSLSGSSQSSQRMGSTPLQLRNIKITPSNSNVYLSDDSIGSASDLRVNINDEEREHYESEGESDEKSASRHVASSRHSRRCSFNELESINTCGSSVYHAESDSATTHDDICNVSLSRRRKEKTTHGCPPVKDVESDLFVGHQYGEKPLLADDELDSSEGGYSSDGNHASPSLMSPNVAVPKCWDDQSSVDVFALAPFPTFFESEVVPNVEEASLVDIGHSLLKGSSAIDASKNLSYSSMRGSTPIRTCNDEGRKQNSEDLFGSPPFENTSLVSTFQEIGSCARPNCISTSTNFRKKVLENSPLVISEGVARKLPELRSLDSEHKGASSQTAAFYCQYDKFPHSMYTSAKENDQHVESDLFGATPFTCEGKIPSQSSCPGALNLSQSSNEMTQSWPSNVSGQAQYQTVSVLPSKLEGNVESLQKQGSHSKEGKYQLIDGARPPGKPNILPLKNSQKTKISSTLSRKSKSGRKTAEKIGGFQNMSFEDFSSDDPGEPPTDINQFEVMRTESSRAVEVERKSSLKRRSNPFT
ncbi:hypothetical protein ONE63_002799 [Megalurothrips usitatus]|uniref:Uncharacterized protein n=1 Tax=Megalurothrips usitatus TaxID=439358 RepID=A0AAV7X9A0_9NEOP|nr:hypothetical protein ONE63_002799 [Megalurothrips usitatus]